ncbi:MAG: hypothetical protein JKY11_03970 [Alphaproteobacteria bacterium]|nr:hypothetical protein [Alphaproteobacteria bacterium]
MSGCPTEQEKNIHDCYNTIAAMTCYAGFLMEDLPPSSEMYKFSKRIYTSAKRAKLLLDEITQEKMVEDATKKVV